MNLLGQNTHNGDTGDTMKTLKEKIEVMQAALDGKTIEFKMLKSSINWVDSYNPTNLDFYWGDYDYRIKKEPLVLYVNVYDNGERILHTNLSRANDLLNTDKDIGGRTIMMREVMPNEQDKE